MAAARTRPPFRAATARSPGCHHGHHFAADGSYVVRIVVEQDAPGLSFGPQQAVLVPLDMEPALDPTGGPQVRLDAGALQALQADQPVTGSMATIYEAPFLMPDCVTVTIHWGDGTSTAGLLSAGEGGNWTVTPVDQDHVYRDPGLYLVHITVMCAECGIDAEDRATAVVTAGGLGVAGATLAIGPSGVSNALLATISAAPGDKASDFAVVMAGESDTVVDLGGGEFGVVGSRGSFPGGAFEVDVLDTKTGATGQGFGSIFAADANAFVPADFNAGYFINGNSVAPHITSMIDYGDGAVANDLKILLPAPGPDAIDAFHLYTVPGTYTVMTTITSGSDLAFDIGTIAVAPAPLFVLAGRSSMSGQSGSDVGGDLAVIADYAGLSKDRPDQRRDRLGGWRVEHGRGG